MAISALARSGLLLVAASAWLAGCSGSDSSRPDILLVTLDTTRVDHLGCYGYDRPTTPNIDRLAAESVVYTAATATASATLPSHASLFTGKLTTSHGARTDPEGPLELADALGPEFGLFRARGLSPEEQTLAEILAGAGYATGAVVAGPWLKQLFGLSLGFDSYDDSEITVLNGRSAESVTASAVRWLEQREGDRPFFLFLNYFDPHWPHSPPDEYTRIFLPGGKPERRLHLDEWIAMYDAELRYMDHHFGLLLDRMRDLDLYDDAWIIVTADHGELLGEHELFGHGKHLYREITRVPLILKYPHGEVPPRRDDTRVQLIDLMPMICERLALAPPDGIQGQSPPGLSHPIVAESFLLPHMEIGDWHRLDEGGFTLHRNSLGNHMLFDGRADPSKSVNLAGSRPEKVEQMTDRLNRYLASLPAPPRPGPAEPVDPETQEALKSLGYIE